MERKPAHRIDQTCVGKREKRHRISNAREATKKNIHIKIEFRGEKEKSCRAGLFVFLDFRWCRVTLNARYICTQEVRKEKKKVKQIQV